MCYLYLVRQKDNSKFKVGYTTNPRARAKQYLTHSLDVVYIAHIEVPNKSFEKFCHLELMKKYKKCGDKTEWFEGYIDYKDFYDIITIIKGRIK